MQADLTIDGYVTENTMFQSMGSPVAGAEIWASACGASLIQTTTASDGYYSLTVPGGDLVECDWVSLDVLAPGYAPWMADYPTDALIANPRVDVTLSRAAGLWNWLPLVMK